MQRGRKKKGHTMIQRESRFDVNGINRSDMLSSGKPSNAFLALGNAHRAAAAATTATAEAHNTAETGMATTAARKPTGGQGGGALSSSSLSPPAAAATGATGVHHQRPNRFQSMHPCWRNQEGEESRWRASKELEQNERIMLRTLLRQDSLTTMASTQLTLSTDIILDDDDDDGGDDYDDHEDTTHHMGHERRQYRRRPQASTARPLLGSHDDNDNDDDHDHDHDDIDGNENEDGDHGRATNTKDTNDYATDKFAALPSRRPSQPLRKRSNTAQTQRQQQHQHQQKNEESMSQRHRRQQHRQLSTSHHSSSRQHRRSSGTASTSSSSSIIMRHDLIHATIHDFYDDMNSNIKSKSIEVWNSLFDKYHAPDYIMVRPSGNPVNSNGLIQMFISQDLQLLEFKLQSIDSVQWIAENTVAVVTYTVDQKFTYKGTLNEDRTLMTCVLEEFDGDIKMCHEHRTMGWPIPKDVSS
mmetsp:Transcript_5277/g.15425  ORF Transcript_5277/g.15425 Transcript_5277/m.15425 type:complete len:470 (-) Transcript_5277:66-1475(-)